jgi:predicted amidophosphoribosyltransferase
MSRVAELTDLYANFMLGPRPGPSVCEVCLDLTDGRRRCLRCDRAPEWLDAVAPVSYSVAHEQLHHALAGYKRPPAVVARRFEIELAAVLWRFLAVHEPCLAHAAATNEFELVTTVPSSNRQRDRAHPLHRIVGELAGPTRARFKRVLSRSAAAVRPRTYDPAKFETARDLTGTSVLLIDDTWTTGANARSAAAALKQAGAATVAAVVIGRHLHRDYGDNDRQLGALSSPFDWEGCALHHRRANRVIATRF